MSPSSYVDQLAVLSLLLVGVCYTLQHWSSTVDLQKTKPDSFTDVVSHRSAHSKHAAASLSQKEGSPGYCGSR